jgi:hypothetical protein
VEQYVPGRDLRGCLRQRVAGRDPVLVRGPSLVPAGRAFEGPQHLCDAGLGPSRPVVLRDPVEGMARLYCAETARRAELGVLDDNVRHEHLSFAMDARLSACIGIYTDTGTFNGAFQPVWNCLSRSFFTGQEK